MLFIVAAIGIVGSILFGLIGLVTEQAGELERIFALMSFFMAAAAVIGIVLDDGISDRSPVLTREEKIDLWIGLPVALFMLVVLLATLIPSIYVMLPVFAARRLFLSAQRPRELPPPGRRAHHAPAYA